MVIKEKKKMCVIGLGYIGLPTAAIFATHGYEVVGCDINKEIIDALNRREIIIEEPYLDILVQAAVTSGNLRGQLEPEDADCFIIAVPTPIDKQKRAVMDYVISATESIVPFLKKGNIVILESTSPVGTVDDLLLPILAKSGLEIGTELYVGHSPERVLPGQILMELVNNNRIVGGVNEESSNKIRDIYRLFVKGEIMLTSSRTAEMCKLMENTYRDVNIALANELAVICEHSKINVWDVVKLCNNHPRVNIHSPGPGVGGHCLAVDPWFIVEKIPEKSKIIELSRKTNDAMPDFVFEKIKNIVKDIDGIKKITILGVTYKPNVDDMRESPIIELVEKLENCDDINVSVFDPYVKKYSANIQESVQNSDLIVLGVNHECFLTLNYKEIARAMKNKMILDTRNFLDAKSLRTYGFTYYLLGNGEG